MYESEIIDFMDYGDADSVQRHEMYIKDVDKLRNNGQWSHDLNDVVPLMITNILDRPTTIYSSDLNKPVLNIETIEPGDIIATKKPLLLAHIALPGKEHFDYCVATDRGLTQPSTPPVDCTATDASNEAQHDASNEEDLHTEQTVIRDDGSINDESVFIGRRRRREELWKCNARKKETKCQWWVPKKRWKDQKSQKNEIGMRTQV